jgi:hypothetical protein
MTAPPALRPGRRILGISAVLLPFRPDGDVDWPGFETLLADTVSAGLLPAVNMDTGYVQLLDPPTRARVLECAAATAGPGGFVAGAFVADEPGAPFSVDAYLDALDAVTRAGGTPVVFPSYGLNALDDDAWVAAHEAFGEHCDRFIGFELGAMFVPYGRISSLSAYEVSGAASGRSTRRCRGRSSGTASRCATGCAPTSTCSPGTTSPSTWSATDPTTCSGSRPSRRPRSPSATGGGPRTTARSTS